MYETILVPTDGSEVADVALEHAVDAAERHDATIHLLYVADMRIAESAPELTLSDIKDALQEEGQKVTGALARRVRDADIETETAVREGVPDDEILTYAREIDTDLVVMGTHGKSQRERLLVGSVTDRVMHGTDIPLLVVSDGDASA